MEEYIEIVLLDEEELFKMIVLLDEFFNLIILN